MQSFSIAVGQSTVHGWKIGEGHRCVVAFHGFSEEAKGFAALWPAFPAGTMLLAIDFPYHGHTQWGEKAFTMDDLQQVLQQLLQQFQVERFSLMGFSMGGRLALSLAPLVAPQLDRLLLLAPDGIQTHRIFDMAVYPAWGRWAFRAVTQQPRLFLWTARMLHRSGLLSRFIYEFTLNHMNTGEKRYRIFHTWLSLAQFVPNLTAVATAMQAHGVSVHLFFGANDEVIRPAVGKKFVQIMPEATVHLIPRGHKLVDKSTVPYLRKIFTP